MRRAAGTVALAALLLAAAPSGTAGHPDHRATEIGISRFAFTPQRLEIVAGDVVFWTWNGPDLNHTVTGRGPGKTFESDPGVAPEQVSHRAGDRFADAFSTPGTYTYLCRVHPDRMRATIVVAPVDRTAPALRRVSLEPARMCRRCRRPGGRLRFTLSERADVEVRIYRVRRGRLAFAARRRFSGRRGRNAPRFHVAGLRPGAYQARIRAHDDADNASRTVRRRFVVVGR